MKLTSSVFDHNGMIPIRYTCEGEEVSPPLTISDPPSGTESLALIVQDPDAPSGDFVHWLIWNIGPEVWEITEGTIPKAAQAGTNDAGKVGWSGPCPPLGKHRYEFHLYALKKTLAIPETALKDELRATIKENTIQEAVLTGLYEKVLE
jgi:Raf kinase inhibitor-like YbhB/YbcL family protein